MGWRGNVTVYFSGSIITGLYTGFCSSPGLIFLVIKWLPLHLASHSYTIVAIRMTRIKAKWFLFTNLTTLSNKYNFIRNQGHIYLYLRSKLSHVINPISRRDDKNKHLQIGKTLSWLSQTKICANQLVTFLLWKNSVINKEWNGCWISNQYCLSYSLSQDDGLNNQHLRLN